MKLVYLLSIIVVFFNVFLQVLLKRNNNLFLVWQGAFLYIVAFEGFFHFEDFIFKSSAYALPASKFLVITFYLSCIGYHTVSILLNRKERILSKVSNKYIEIILENSLLTVILIMGLYSFYLILNFNSAINGFLGGRSSTGTIDVGNLGFIVGALNNSIAMTLPAIIAFNYKYVLKTPRYRSFTFIVTLPIFIVQVLLGTRLVLLFSLGCMLIVILEGLELKARKIIKLGIIALMFLLIVDLMKRTRTYGLANFDLSQLANLSFLEMFYSREGLNYAISLLIEYFKFNSHTLGVQSTFVLYFWIPRFIWPSKPLMLGYWLIRSFNIGGFSSNHSISFGFAGDAYADFGILGGIVFSLFIGSILFLFEQKRVNSAIEILPKSIVYPLFFLAMRSPQTSLMNYFGMWIIVKFYMSTLRRKNDERIINQL